MTVTAPSTRRWPALRPWLGTAARLGLAAVWLIAGGAKVGDLAASGRAVLLEPPVLRRCRTTG